MKNFKWQWQDTLIVILGLISLCYALFNYGKLPDRLPAQFSITGEVNRYWGKDTVIALLFIMGTIFPLGMQFIRNIDPRRENYDKFQNAFKMIRLAVGILCDAVLLLTVSYGLNEQFPAAKWSTASLGVLFIVIGNFMPQIKDNYFTGIRTPWTLANPEVWRRTHRFSGVMWVISGLLFILGAFMPVALSVSMIIAALVIAVVLPYVYSWLISRGIRT